MNDILPSLPRGAWVGVIRLRSLGDTVLMTPALHGLKTWRPDLRVAAVVEPRFAAVLAGNPDVDQVIETPALRKLRSLRPALVVGLHGGTTAARLARLSGAPVRATFAGLRHRWAYNVFAPAKPQPLHTVEHVASLFHALGMPEGAMGPLRVFPTSKQELGEPYVFFNVEAREPGMRWPRAHYAELMARLRQERGWASVQASADPTAAAAPGVKIFAGSSVRDLIGLIAGAELVVGSDGGPIHIAAALGKPTLVLYSTTDIPVWSPWQTASAWVQAADLRSVSSERVYSALSALAGST